MKALNNNSRMLFLSMVAVLFMTSCGTDWLDIKPLGRFTEDDLPTGSLEEHVFAAYAALRSEGTSGLQYVGLHNIRSDDANLGSNVNDYAIGGPIYDNYNYSLTHWHAPDYWTCNFCMIQIAHNYFSDQHSLV